MSIAIAFFKPHNVTGKLISWWTKSTFCHVAIRLEMHHSHYYLHSLSGKGVVLTAATRTRTPDTAVELPWAPADLLEDWALSCLGTKYGWSDAANFVFNVGHSDFPGMTCSEYVACFLLLAVSLGDGPPELSNTIKAKLSEPAQRSPGDIAAILLGHR